MCLSFPESGAGLVSRLMSCLGLVNNGWGRSLLLERSLPAPPPPQGDLGRLHQPGTWRLSFLLSIFIT